MTNRPRPGELLVASIAMEGYWVNAVVLLLDCDGEGAVGVRLDRRSEHGLDDLLPHWARLVCEPRVLFEGGPVSTDGAVCLARLPENTPEPPDWRHISNNLGLLHLDTPVELVEVGFADLRIFAGYCGWDAGQLEDEIARGDWYRIPSSPEIVFTAEPEGLWRRVLRLHGGDLSLLSTWTDDPEVN